MSAPRNFLVWSNAHGGWWKEGRGYTLVIDQARRFTHHEAEGIVMRGIQEMLYTSAEAPSESMILAPEYRWDTPARQPDADDAPYILMHWWPDGTSILACYGPFETRGAAALILQTLVKAGTEAGEWQLQPLMMLPDGIQAARWQRAWTRSPHSPTQVCDCPSPRGPGLPYHCAATGEDVTP